MNTYNDFSRMKVGAVILAAGGSSRFGMPKQVLNWGNQTFLNCIIDKAKQAELDPVLVVLGAYADEIIPSIESHDIQVLINNRWKDGQSSSLRLAVEALENDVKGVFFLLVDQPHLSLDLLLALKERTELDTDILVPWIKGRYANPVYFSHRCFEALKQIKGDQGGRSLFQSFNTKILEWQDDWMALDIDTPQDYAKLCRHYGISDTHLV